MYHYVDTETELMDGPIPRLVCVSRMGHPLIKWDDPGARQVVRMILNTGTIVAHNAAFDMAVLGQQYNIWPDVFRAYDEGRVWCTMLAQKYIDNHNGVYTPGGGGYSLSALTNGAKHNDTWRMRYGELRDIPLSDWPHDAQMYAQVDADILQGLHSRQVETGVLTGLQDYHDQCAYALGTLLTSSHGLRIDRKRLGQVMTDTEARITRQTEMLLDTGILTRDMRGRAPNKEFSGTYTLKRDRAAAHFTQVAGARIHLLDRNSKGVSINQDNASILGDPISEAIVEYKAQGKIRAVLQALDKDIIHTTFEPFVRTGRMSSRTPNVQNFHRGSGIRECIIPRDGHVIIGADYGGLELHTLGQFCLTEFGYSRMGEVLMSGVDIHTDTAKVLGGNRSLAKMANFSVPGGGGPATLAKQAAGYGVSITEYEAKIVKEAFLQKYPEIRDLFNWVNELPEVSRLVGGSWVRFKQVRLHNGRQRGDATFCSACNYVFQGPGSDVTKRALYLIWRGILAHGENAPRPINCVHDEILGEAPIDSAMEYAVQQEEHMAAAGRYYCPDISPVAIAEASTRWTKSARRIVEDGRLIAYDVDKETRV